MNILNLDLIDKRKRPDGFDLSVSILNHQSKDNHYKTLILKDNHLIDLIEYHPDIQKDTKGNLSTKDDDFTLALKKTNIIYLEGFDNRAYIIDNNGEKTLVLKDAFDPKDMEKLKKELTKMNIKPNSVYGSENNMLSYREAIDNNVETLRRNYDNKDYNFILSMRSAFIATVFTQKLKQKREKIKKYLKRKKLLESMDYDVDDDEELKHLAKEFSEKEKYYLKLSTDERIKQMTTHVRKMLTESNMSDSMKNKIENDIVAGKYDDVLANNVQPNVAFAEVVFKDHDYLRKIFDSKPDILRNGLKNDLNML